MEAPIDQQAAARLALGRILRLASRPSQLGDVEEYERCRAIILDVHAPDATFRADPVHSYARDHGKGAAGQW